MDINNTKLISNLYGCVDNIDFDLILNVLSKIDQLTLICFLNFCNDTTKNTIIKAIPEYMVEEFVSNLDRLSGRIPFGDSVKARNIVINIFNNKNSFVKNPGSSIFCFGYEELEEYKKYETIPKNSSLDYNIFISVYYDILWLLYICRNVSCKCGLLEIENFISFLKNDDFIYLGLRYITSGLGEAASLILSRHIKKETNAYKKMLKRIAAEGILMIGEEKCSPDELVLSLIRHSNITDDITINASGEYENGDTEAFKKLFKKNSCLSRRMIENHEREEIAFFRKLIKYSGMIYRGGLDYIKGKLDKDLVEEKDLFEYGIYLIIKYENEGTTRTILENRSGAVNPYLSIAKMEAVLSIQRRDSRVALYEIVLSCFEDDISSEIRETFKDELWL